MIEKENKAKHTPGPWRQGDKTNNWHKIYGGGNNPIAEIRPIHKNGEREKGDFIIEESNAALISAAPDLLEACESLVRLWENWAKDSMFLGEPLRRSIEMRVEEISAAIQKARGEK